jgi:GT2 family glycosyltransferase/exo-beta-1,3-glucanase (GH17 family)
MVGIEIDASTADGVVTARSQGRSARHDLTDVVTPVTKVAGRHGTSLSRITANGVFLERDGEPFFVRGVTYGSFTPRSDGIPYPETARIRADFEQIAALGLNTVRLYTAPTADLLEAAADRGLYLIVGVDYPDWRYPHAPGRRTQRLVLDNGRRSLEEALEVCAGRPEVLAISVGNEVPADMVRVHGITAVSDVLSELVEHVRVSDPEVLATYTNYPTTEFIHVEGQTLATFNVFLEDRGSFRRYLRHLQVTTGGLPLVVTELGLAAEVHGLDRQADTLDWQLREVDETGCAGAAVFAFTDEWGVNGEAVDGWGFGITTAQRELKPSAGVAGAWAARDLVDHRDVWPRISVVVCAYNEELMIEDCLTSLVCCDYPDLEVIVCDDGSTDGTLDIARRFPFRVLDLEHGGLSRARNAGIEAATGQLVAFLDADAACHPLWPWHLALSFDTDRVVASGGPNLPFPDASLIERAVALSPGQPAEVLLADDRAEHVPGCNMTVRRDALLDIDCFNPVYTSAGDDVDVCWKLLEAGGEIAFSPAAQVHHHRRATVSGYLRQQRGYGRAEKLLMSAHAHRFNRHGQARWAGSIYGGAQLFRSLLRPVIYHGYHGNAPFQPVQSRPAEIALARTGALLPLIVPAALIGILAAAFHSPWWFVLAGLALVAPLLYGAAVAVSLSLPRREPARLKLRILVGFLHGAQPFVRTWGRLRGPPRTRRSTVASDAWTGDRAQWLAELERQLRTRRVGVLIAAPSRSWDLEARRIFTRVLVTTAVAWSWEPVWRLRTRLRPVPVGAVIASALVALFGSWTLAITVGLVGLALVGAEAWWLRSTVRKVVKLVTRSTVSVPTVGQDAETSDAAAVERARS